MEHSIIILDYGSQYTQLIARRIRELGVYAEVQPYTISVEELRHKQPNGIILSGGPASVYAPGAPTVDRAIFDLNIPVLGICYGMQLITHLFDGVVERADKQEFGKAQLFIDDVHNPLFQGIPTGQLVWMSHADHIAKLPVGFQQVAHSDNSISTIANLEKQIYGVQFHPEVTHSSIGVQLLSNFVFNIAHCTKNWNMHDFIERTVAKIREQVQDQRVILGLSGGVDSSVAAMLIHRAIGKQLTCIFVDTGLLRKNEAQQVMDIFGRTFDLNLQLVNAEELFLTKLCGVSEPEAKRKIIGKTFIDVFASEAKKINGAKFLAQGTIYPDVIESQSVKGPSQTIKSHHNVGGLPEDLSFELLEPLRELFKDEVRKVGLELGIPAQLIYRHPFPGPGLGIRVIGEVTKEKADILREADAVFINELHAQNLYNEVSQAFVALLPVKTVGVMGDERTYDYTVALRSVNTIDFMTASVSRLSYEFLETVATKIINEVKGVNRIVYDITSKPPGTIEWE